MAIEQDHNTRTVDETMAQLRADNASLRAQVIALQAMVSDLETLADMDTLTPLPNRRCFMREVGRVVARVARYGNPAAVIFVDVDALKAINDRHGHSAGDAALNHVAALLRREVRAGDLVARIGGDEFGLLLDHVDTASAAAKSAALLAATRTTPMTLANGQELVVRVSLGMAMVTAEDSVETLLARADARMYAAKADQRSDT
jgi:diguanylate cyclase (GGDEF)-like protein